MKRFKFLCLLGLAASVLPAHAVVINLGLYPQPGSDSPASELAFLNSTVIPAYNNTQPGTANDLPAALAGSQNIEASGQPLSVTVDATGFEYIKLKWGPAWQYYYVAGQGTTLFQSTNFNQNNQPQALSHYTFFNSTLAPEGPGPGTPPSVADGGTTVLLLGAALTGLVYFRRRLLKS